MSHHGAMALALLALAGCGGGGASPADAGGSDRLALPACAMAASLYTVSLAGARQDLGDGSQLGIVLGFQGFQFARIGLATAEALPTITTVQSAVLVAGKVNRTTSNGSISTSRGAVGWETETLSVFFNDAPLAELIGADGVVALRATGTSCIATGQAHVVLVSGGFQGADGGTDVDGGIDAAGGTDATDGGTDATDGGTDAADAAVGT